MAKFLAYYNLCPIHDTKDFLGLSKDKDDGNIITTLGRNIVIVIKLTNQKQLRSWTVLDKLSSKVVYNKKSDVYVGVFANKYIRCWDENVTDVNKIKKIKFSKNIVDLIENDEVIVLYNDGSCESLSSAIDSRKNENNISSEVQHNLVNNSNVFELYDGRKMLTYFYRNEKTNVINLVTMYLDENNLKPIESPKIYKLERQIQNVTLSGYTVIEGHHFPSLITIWSDKRIFSMSLDDNVTLKDAPGNILSMIEILNVNNPLSVIGISKNCVAIYGANSGQEGASLILYNTQFKVVKAKQFFKIYFDFSRLWVIGCNILLVMGQNLSVVSFRVSKELLSEIIGSQASNDIQSYVVDDLINEEYELEDSIQLSKITNNNLVEISYEKTNEKIVNNKIADGKILPFQSYNDFHNNFNDLCSHNINFEILSSATPNDEIKINLLSNFYTNETFKLDEIEIIANELKKCGASEQEISEKLLTLLIKAEDHENIAICLRRYTNISEKIITKVLKYTLIDLNVNLTNDSNNILKENSTTSKEYENNTEINFICDEQEKLDLLLNKSCIIKHKTKNDLINLILSLSFDAENISRYIRKEINLNEALTLLKHLYNLIVSKENCLEECSSDTVEFDEDIKIFQWFGILLNTHFQKLALSRDLELIELLLKWHKILIQYKNQLRDLEDFSAVLYNLVNQKQIVKENKSSKWYSIEVVNLF